MRAWSTLALCAALALGCFQTHYVNFSPQNPMRGDAAPEQPVKAGASWRSFFLFGVAPAEVRVDAARACGGAENVDSIRTQQTFAQGLVEEIAGYYINIYSPWDGAVYCKRDPRSTAAATPAAAPAPAPAATPAAE